MVSFQEAENYINEIPRFAGKNSVEDTARLLSMVGCDRLPAKIVHVAGTNGKGSVCSYLAAILKQAGFRVGRFTSPHLQASVKGSVWMTGRSQRRNLSPPMKR